MQITKTKISELESLLESLKQWFDPGDWTLHNTNWINAVGKKGRGEVHVADVRGWGYFTGGGHGALNLSREEGIAAQEAIGRLIIEAVNMLPEFIDVAKTYHPALANEEA